MFTDSIDHCSYLKVDLCNKYSVEEDHNHFHVDFRFVSLLQHLNILHIIVTLLFMAGFSLRMCFPRGDIRFLRFIFPRRSEIYDERWTVLLESSVLAMLGSMVTSFTSLQVLFGNFPHSRSTVPFEFMMDQVINGEYIRLLSSENYYRIFHIFFIINNLRNGRKWNEDVLHHPRAAFRKRIITNLYLSLCVARLIIFVKVLFLIVFLLEVVCLYYVLNFACIYFHSCLYIFQILLEHLFSSGDACNTL